MDARPPEYVLAIKLGVRQTKLASIRRTLTRDQHWTKAHGNRIYWTDEGLAVLYERLGLKAQAADIPSPVDEVKQFVVVQCHFPNRRIMTAQNGSGEIIRVWVKDAWAFKPKVRIWARPGPGAAWRFVGKVRKTQYGI